MTAHDLAMHRSDLPDWPRLMSEPMAARYVSVSATTLRELGPEPKRLGRRVLYDRRDLDRWADALGSAEQPAQPLDQPEREAEGDDIHRRIEERLRRNASC